MCARLDSEYYMVYINLYLKYWVTSDDEEYYI